jgi:hypothetical protein
MKYKNYKSIRVIEVIPFLYSYTPILAAYFLGIFPSLCAAS